MPGLLVASVSCGAQVITVTGASPEPPVAPGTSPHAAVSDTHRATAHAARAPARTGREEREGAGTGRERVRRLPVMDTHDSLTPLTPE
ncbi:hypothetical protein Srubr_69340 [Streptomyces rubradiris]|uniref:Uncharacterized protein n=1 Tax=Streptomyces rubradiris TaxID=285531 RepID=A0ABQ3RMJ4_STRRR|nr:hypothetical protein GCM10018792_19730 [Streptomyces rubradiris]GHI57088.1 hypothetical protein Srubr_69340 [Streptomyces rubradiris]